MSERSKPDPDLDRRINDGEVADFVCIMAAGALFFILLLLALWLLGVPL